MEPLVRGLLCLVKSVYVEDWRSYRGWFEEICAMLSSQVEEELPSMDRSSMLPDAVLVKVEGLVEMVHYLTIFCVGVKEKKIEPVSPPSFLVNLLLELIPPIKKAVAGFVPSIRDDPSDNLHGNPALLKHKTHLCAQLVEDWKTISRHSLECLDVSANILESLFIS